MNRAKQLANTCWTEHPEMRAACVAASQAPAQKKIDDQAGGFSKAVDKMLDQLRGCCRSDGSSGLSPELSRSKRKVNTSPDFIIDRSCHSPIGV